MNAVLCYNEEIVMSRYSCLHILAHYVILYSEVLTNYLSILRDETSSLIMPP